MTHSQAKRRIQEMRRNGTQPAGMWSRERMAAFNRSQAAVNGTRREVTNGVMDWHYHPITAEGTQLLTAFVNRDRAAYFAGPNGTVENCPYSGCRIER